MHAGGLGFSMNHATRVPSKRRLGGDRLPRSKVALVCLMAALLPSCISKDTEIKFGFPQIAVSKNDQNAIVLWVGPCALPIRQGGLIFANRNADGTDIWSGAFRETVVGDRVLLVPSAISTKDAGFNGFENRADTVMIQEFSGRGNVFSYQLFRPNTLRPGNWWIDGRFRSERAARKALNCG